MDATSSGFELRDHTADLVLHAWGSTIEGLFLSAAEGLYAAIGRVETGDVTERVNLRFDAPDRAALLQDFLSELLFQFETRQERITDLEIVSLEEMALVVRGVAYKVDAERSMLDREVKAVTYHDLEIVQHDGQHEVDIVLDI